MHSIDSETKTFGNALKTERKLPNSMEQSPSWEANTSSASQEITRILWNRIHNSPPPVPILSPIYPAHSLLPFPLLEDPF